MKIHQINEILKFTTCLLITLFIVVFALWGVLDYVFEMGRTIGCTK